MVFICSYFKSINKVLEWLLFIFVGTLKPTIMLEWLIPAIGAGVSLAQKFIGNRKERRFREELEGEVKKRQEGLDAFFNKEYYKPFTESEIAKDTLARSREQMKSLADRMNTTSAAGGGTVEGKVAMMEKANQGYNEILGRLSGMGYAHKQNLLSNYQTRSDNLQNQMFNLNQARLNDYANLDANIQSALGNILLASAFGGKGGQENQTSVLPNPELYGT